MLRVGVILSGCGVHDGSEIHEAVLTLLALDEANADAVCIAPNKQQARVFDHAAGRATTESRNVLTESARIARGNIRDIASVRADELDAIILPGGFGAALNLCDFAHKGEGCVVDPHTERLLVEMRRAKKPIGAMCIAPAILARVFGKDGVKLTIGTDHATKEKLEHLGCKHVDCSPTELVVDQEHRFVTTPAYMNASRISEAAQGIRKLVTEVLRMAKA